VDDDSEVSEQEGAAEELAPFAVAEPQPAPAEAAGEPVEVAGESGTGRRRGLRRTKVPA
jgi:hypothetical protein